MMTRFNATTVTVFGIVSALGWYGTPAQAVQFKVYGYGAPAAKEFEFVYAPTYVQSSDNKMAFFGKTGIDREGLILHTLELEYGITDKWSAAVYGDFEQPSGESLKFTQTRAVVSRYNFFAKGEKPVDMGIYVEYYRPREAYLSAKHDILELRFILEKEYAGLDWRLNPIIEKVVNGPGKDQSADIEFSAAVYKEMSDRYEIGLEAYQGEAQGGPQGKKKEEQYIAPAVDFKVKDGVEVHGAVAVGVSDAADDVVLIGRLEMEL